MTKIDARTELIVKNRNNPMFLARQFLVDNPNFVATRDLDNKKLVYHYNGKCWDLLVEDEITSMAYDFYCKFSLEIFCKPNKINELIKAVMFGTKMKEVVMNNDATKLVLNNGVLDLLTNTISPHSPGYFYDSYIPVDYNPSLTEDDCPIFMNFLREVLDNNQMYINNALMLGGYLFDYSLKANKLFFLDGPGASGKSTLLNVYLMMWNESQISALSLEDISSKGFDKEALITSRVNVSGEQKRDYLDAETLKLVSEGARVSITRKFLKTVSVHLKAKILLACNGMPKFKDTSDGIYRRLSIFTFKNRYKPADEYERELKKGDLYVSTMRIKKQDRSLIEKMEKEKSAIFNVFLKYLKILREREYHFHESIAELNEYKNDNDSMTEFLSSNYLHSERSDGSDWVTVHEVSDHYRQWYSDNVGPVHTLKMRTNEIGRRITEHFGLLSTDRRKVVRNPDGSLSKNRMYALRRTMSSFMDNDVIMGLADGSLVSDQPTPSVDDVGQMDFLK